MDTPEIFKSKNGWRWRLRAPNGRLLAGSLEPFYHQRNAERAYRRCFGNFTTDQLAAAHKPVKVIP